MDPRARERLSAAAQEFMAAEPWTRLSPRHLVGIRDRPTGRLACALVAARGSSDRALLLGLGPGAFERFALSWKEIARAWDLPEEEKGLVFSTIGPLDLASAGGAFAKMLIHRTQEAPTGRAAFQTVLGIGSHIRGPTYKELTAPELNG